MRIVSVRRRAFIQTFGVPPQGIRRQARALKPQDTLGDWQHELVDQNRAARVAKE
jgi:hypothetical protein